jgi:predicted small metal-binding protein
MYEFLCDHIIPGCTHKESGEDREEVLERAMAHLQAHGELEGDLEEIKDKVVNDAMIFTLR